MESVKVTPLGGLITVILMKSFCTSVGIKKSEIAKIANYILFYMALICSLRS